MIFSTFNQFTCFLIFLYFGIITSVLSQLFFMLFLKNYQKNVLKNVIFAINYAIFLIFFVILLNIFNFGQFSIVLILAYLFGYFWIKKLSNNLVVFLEKKWYNVCTKSRKKKHGTEQKS